MDTPDHYPRTRQATAIVRKPQIESEIKTSVRMLTNSNGRDVPTVKWIRFKNARDADKLNREISFEIFNQRRGFVTDNYSRVEACMALLAGEARIDEVVKQLSDPHLATVNLLCTTLLSGLNPLRVYNYAARLAYSKDNNPSDIPISNTEAFVKLASEKVLDFLLQSPELCSGSEREELLAISRKTETNPADTTGDKSELSQSNVKTPTITFKSFENTKRKSNSFVSREKSPQSIDDTVPQKRKREQPGDTIDDNQLQHLIVAKKQQTSIKIPLSTTSSASSKPSPATVVPATPQLVSTAAPSMTTAQVTKSFSTDVLRSKSGSTGLTEPITTSQPHVDNDSRPPIVSSMFGLQDISADISEAISKLIDMSKQNKLLIEENQALNNEKREMQIHFNEMQELDADKYHEAICKLEIAEEQLWQEKKKTEELSKSNEAMNSLFHKLKKAMDDANGLGIK